MTEALLSVRELSLAITSGAAHRPIVDAVSFDIPKGSALALVGESGSGKSLIAAALLRLLPLGAEVTGGSIHFAGRSLFALSERELSRLRGKEICLAFQEPSSALNPYATVRSWLSQPLKLHNIVPAYQIEERARQVLQQVGVSSAETKLDKYPHELSQGDQRRLLLASALSCEPRLIVLDQPLLGLDPTAQAQLLDTLQRLQANLGLTLLIITHDLHLVSEAADQVVVLYSGQVIEQGACAEVLERPAHPYTRGLLGSALPEDIVGPPSARRLPTIAGSAQRDQALQGCRFRLRCAYRQSEPLGYERCDTLEPELTQLEGDHLARCHFASELV